MHKKSTKWSTVRIEMNLELNTYPNCATILIEHYCHVHLPNPELPQQIPDRHGICTIKQNWDVPSLKQYAFVVLNS